jgi:hypothetical protein
MDLESLFQSSPVAQAVGMQNIGLEQDQTRQRLAEIAQKMQHAEQRQPLELAQLQLGNDTTAAQLPGIKAKSSMLGDDATFSARTLGGRIDQALAEQKGKISKEQLQQLKDTGEKYAQSESLLDNMPGLATHAQARQILGDAYMDSFDQVPPKILGKVLGHIGRQMVASQGKFLQQEDLARTKAEEAAKLQKQKDDAKLEQEAFKARLKENLEKVKKELDKAKDPKKYEEAATQLMLAAQKETDPEKKQAILEEATKFYQAQIQVVRERAEASKAGKVDVGEATGMPTVPTQPLPNVPGMAPPAAPAPASNKPASLADVQKMYPGVPPDKLKEAYKRKFGVDLQ